MKTSFKNKDKSSTAGKMDLRYFSLVFPLSTTKNP